LLAKFTLLKLYHELGGAECRRRHLQSFYFSSFLTRCPPTKHKGAPPLWAERLKDLLHDEWDKNFHLDDLSARLGVHPVTISRYFPLYFATTLGNYMLQIKGEQSAHHDPRQHRAAYPNCL
jgi:AraC family transcriptional regulator